MSEKRPVGRPRVLTHALKTEICERIIDGETIRQIAAEAHLPDARTIYRTLAAEDEAEFRQQYARAKEFQLYRMEDELLEIADDATNDWMEKRDRATGEAIDWQVNGEHIQRSRVRIDTRKWIMSKRAPKKYGDRIQQEIETSDGQPISFPVVRVYSPKPEEPDAA
jgi:hypothetical protein